MTQWSHETSSVEMDELELVEQQPLLCLFLQQIQQLHHQLPKIDASKQHIFHLKIKRVLLPLKFFHIGTNKQKPDNHK